MAKKKQIELTIEEKLQNALVPKEEQPYKIPNNWCWTYFKDIFYIENGYAFKKIDYKKEGIPLVRISNIENGIVNINECIYVNKLEKNEEKYVIEKGDLLIALSGATTGKNGVYYLDEIAYLNQRIGNIKIKNKEKVLNEYRNYYIALKNEDILNLAYGGAQPNISPKVIEFISIPLPPIKEQQRIVNRIESLFAKLDRAKELIENTLAQFEQNKMAILHKAFTGELTVKWRKKNNINEKNFFNKVKLKNVIKLISGRDVSVSLCNDKSIGIPYILGASNIKDNKFFIERWIENPVVVSEKNDILLSVKGTIGKLYLQKEEKINISRQIMALRALNDLNTHYLYYFLLRECERLKFEGNGLIPGISRKDILDLNILLPTLEEQQEIVNILDKLLAKYNKIKNLEQQLEKIELLKKAILAKAFRGELGTNNPDEESAENLLKEILAEK
ncbi:type I restriction enzyme, S subunit [Megamonas sp. Calf98-2]|uniref:restriction endonuclease subunit S n=1 Tax=Megamonas sp. Calf98-2 TaxID=1855330 RepID=UPI0008BE8447|nr:restriction endonuclease subunit S [Megamonas sp. Calf98-2]SEN64488.1 type I restriction enzyme, S subunit [Megamonas sp. Calf98-2]